MKSEEIAEFRRRLSVGDQFRNVAPEDWPEELRTIDVEQYIAMLRVTVMNAFLREHCSIQFLIQSVGATLVHPIKPLAEKAIYQRGSSMLGINFDLAIVRRSPDSPDYLLICHYRKMLELIETGHPEPYLEGEFREPASVEGFIRLALALVELDSQG
jgi:hypothetical protein